MYGCDKMISQDPELEEDEIRRAYWDMATAVEIAGRPVEKMVIEITRSDNFSVIGWRVHEKATTA